MSKAKITSCLSIPVLVCIVLGLIFTGYTVQSAHIQQKKQLQSNESDKAEKCIKKVEATCDKVDNTLLSLDTVIRLRTAILNHKNKSEPKKNIGTDTIKAATSKATQGSTNKWYQGIEGAMGDIYKQVVADSINQYKITQDSGNAIDVCVHAGMVSAAYLQSQDRINYAKWKEREQIDCENAGVSN